MRGLEATLRADDEPTTRPFSHDDMPRESLTEHALLRANSLLSRGVDAEPVR